MPSWIRQQVLLGAARALIDLGQQPRREGQLVAFTGQGERFELAERQQAGQIVFTIERAHVLDQAALPCQSVDAVIFSVVIEMS